MSATFWDRARQLGIGRLDKTAAEAALTHPLARQEPAVAFTDPALREVIDESQGYPYFLQVWGAALWEAAEETGETVIDASLTARARPAFEDERSTYYQHRRNELERRELLPPSQPGWPMPSRDRSSCRKTPWTPPSPAHRASTRRRR